MATNPRAQYLEQIGLAEKQIQREFTIFVAASVASASIGAIQSHLIEMDVDNIMRDLSITPGSLSATTEAIRAAYMAGGTFEAPAARIIFDMRNPRAEQWIRNHSSDFVTRITASQRDAIRVTLESAMQAGRNPRNTALDIIGRVGANGRRSGGIVGLTGQQSQFVANARRELLDLDGGYFTRVRRDKRFDGMIRRAMDNGKPLPPADVDRIVGRYSDRLLQTRGENIAVTESVTSFNAARHEAAEQAIEQGVISKDLTTGTWIHTSSRNPRDFHLAMSGQIKAIDAPFESPTGARLMYPGDTSLGAGPEDIVNCHCMKRVRYDFIGDAARRSA